MPGICGTVWDPAVGEGHMAQVIADYGHRFRRVVATDVHDTAADDVAPFAQRGGESVA